MATTIILPDHHLIRHPTILRRAGSPHLVNGAVVVDEHDFKLIVFYRSVAPGQPAQEVRTYAISQDDFARTLIAASVDFLPGLLANGHLKH